MSGCSSGVEHNLAKVGVEGSNPFARSNSLFITKIEIRCRVKLGTRHSVRNCVMPVGVRMLRVPGARRHAFDLCLRMG